MLKFILSIFISLLACSSLVQADATYPYQNSTYIPMAQTASIALPTGASTSSVMTLNNIGVVAFRVSGTCTSLAATVQVTNDVGPTKTNWTSVNFWASPALGTAAGTLDIDGSLTAVGYYKTKTDGATAIRFNVSALTAACSLQITGSNWDFNAAYF